MNYRIRNWSNQMYYTEYENPQEYLDVCRAVFEENEALYGLMLGITLRLIKNPLYYGSQPLLATITDNKAVDLIALMTPPYKLQIAMIDPNNQDAIPLLVSKLHENHWHIPALQGEKKAVKAFETHWNSVNGTHSADGMRQRLYKLETVQPIQYPVGTIRQGNIDDLELSLKWNDCFYDDCFGETQSGVRDSRIIKTMLKEGNIYFWDNPGPVSMAAFTRPTTNGISISYVYTPPELRRQGYASAITARLSQIALDRGRKFCTLYTDLNNPTSNSIYQKIGYEPVADIVEVFFKK